MDIAFTKFDSARLLNLWCLARTCLWRKAQTVYELQRSSECYRRQMAWCQHQTVRIRKAMLQWKNIYQQWQSRMENLFSTFSADQLIDDMAYCDVLLSPAYEQQRQWWAVCIICLTMCNTILFLSWLIWKCSKRKFLDIFEDVCSLRVSFSANLFRLLCCIMHANVWDVFLGATRYIYITCQWLVFTDKVNRHTTGLIQMHSKNWQYKKRQVKKLKTVFSQHTVDKTTLVDGGNFI